MNPLSRHSRIAVVGAGAMGAVFGGLLAEGGLDVTLIDVWQDHVDAINANGLTINGQGGDRTIRVRATSDAATVRDADLVLFQCKAIYNRDAARSVAHLFRGTGALALSFQNGLGNEEEIAAVLGEDRVLGGLTAQAALLESPGVVRNFAHLPSTIGEMAGGVSPRATAIAASLSAHGLPTVASDNVRREKWLKLLVNIAFAATSGITDLTLGDVLTLPPLRETARRAMAEAIEVAVADGIELGEGSPYAVFDKIMGSGAAGNKASLGADLRKGRTSEREYIYGSVIKIADKHALRVPTLRALDSLILGIEHRAQHGPRL